MHFECGEAEAPGRTMLGAEQEAWLDGCLAKSDARWTVLAQQVPIFGRDFSTEGEGQYSMDKWTGYPAARERLLASIAERGVPGPVFLSGDVHSHWGANVPRRLEAPDGPSAAVEFTSTSVTSGGDGAPVRDHWAAIQPDNPHVAYHSDLRGYVTCEATPDQWRTDFMVLDRVEVPDGELALGGRLVCEHGSARVEPA